MAQIEAMTKKQSMSKEADDFLKSGINLAQSLGQKVVEKYIMANQKSENNNEQKDNWVKATLKTAGTVTNARASKISTYFVFTAQCDYPWHDDMN